MRYFGGTVCDSTVKGWKAEGRRQVIGQAELVAVPVALCTWEELLTQRDVLVFVDNDAAKACLVRGISMARDSDKIANEARLLSAEIGAACWYERVPSPSNPADGPSRKYLGWLKARGFSPSAMKLKPWLSLLVQVKDFWAV